MKRVLLTVAVALLIPSILMAAPVTVGVYFEGSLAYTPPGGTGTPYIGALYMIQNEYYVTGIEYSLVTPNDIDHTKFIITGYTYPPNHQLSLGNAWTGHSITYWPPLTGYPDGYDLLVTYECINLEVCSKMRDYPICVGAHPDSGHLRGTYAPDHEFFDIIGLTSYLCPNQIGTEEESWGAIKSMYK